MTRPIHRSPRTGNGYGHRVSLRKHEPTSTAKMVIQSLEIIQEFDDYGSHRIRVGERISQWTGYQGFSVLKYKEGRISGCSEYYSGVFPPVFMWFK